ncbi:hypothetical protein BGZ49_003663 [Haplosporangium sp. Z 27]|nr:hypothetical protein BGZ49_003663 [Haplosporangium sp. Z 27]
MSFTIETILDTKVPSVIEFLGPPCPSVQHEVSGKVHLHVQKAVQIKQLTVAFNGEVHANFSLHEVSSSSDAVNICRVEDTLINETSIQYQPGEYTFPFRLSLPGDLTTTDSMQLKSNNLLWAYELVTSAVPSGLFLRRKVLRKSIKLRRVHVPPSETQSTRYAAKRQEGFECSLYAPKIISSQDTKVYLSAFLHPYNESHRVKEIVVQGIQTEKAYFDLEGEMRKQRVKTTVSFHDGLKFHPIKTNDSKTISKALVLPNPDQEEFTTQWGRSAAIEFELDLDSKEILPSESIVWIKVSHGIRFTIVFADPYIRPLNVIAPLQIVNILDEPWIEPSVPDGLTPPDYGVDEVSSSLLDSNTSRLTRQQLRGEQYPEREPIVPDLADDLPPVYDQEERPIPPESEKTTF